MASRTGSGTVAVLAAPETARPNARTAATRSRLFIQASLDRNRSDPLVADVLGAFDLDPPEFVGVRPPQEANELFIDGDALARADVLVALLVDYLELKRVVVRLGIHGHILTGSLAAVEPFLNRAWFPPRLPASESKERTMTGMMIFNLIANPTRLRMVSADEGADRLHAHVRGEKVEARGDELLRSALSPGGLQPATSEEPDYDEPGERLDQAVSAEPNQRN